ncbi:hypothetical protein [Natrinema thermotolerans]
MTVPDLEPLRESLRSRLSELEEREEQREEEYRHDGSDQAVWKKVEPGMRHDIASDCLSDLEQIGDTDTLFKTLAEWQRKRDEKWRHKTTDTTREFNRKDIKQSEIRTWIEELASLIPESKYETCHCGSRKEPVSDRRRKKGFVWECPDCFR